MDSLTNSVVVRVLLVAQAFEDPGNLPLQGRARIQADAVALLDALADTRLDATSLDRYAWTRRRVQALQERRRRG